MWCFLVQFNPGMFQFFILFHQPYYVHRNVWWLNLELLTRNPHGLASGL